MAGRYVNDIPALPPLASGVDDSSAPGITEGEPLAFRDVTAALLQHQNRKRLAVCVPILATEDELVASKRRKLTVQSSNFDGPVPAWAQQMMAAVQEMREDLHQLTRRYDEEKARTMNRSQRRTTDPIEPLLRLVDGDTPNNGRHPQLWFPQNQEDLLVAAPARVNALLRFYNLGDEGNNAEKKFRLMKHLGVIAS